MKHVLFLLGFLLPGTAQAGEIGQCLQDVSPFSVNCTANDVKISRLTAMQIFDGCTGPGDTATVRLVFTTEVQAAERFDLGYYLALDGGNALTGKCQREYLPPPLTYAPTEAALLSGYGPYPDIDGDLCGDGRQGWPMHHVVTDAAHPMGYVPAVLPCVDNNHNGKLDVSYCATWKNANHEMFCSGVDQAGVPQTPSKCKCGILDITPPMPVPTGTPTPKPTPTTVPVTATPAPTTTPDTTPTPGMVDVCTHNCISKITYRKGLDRLWFQTAIKNVPGLDLSSPFQYVLRSSLGVVAFGELPAGAIVDGMYNSKIADVIGGIARVRIWVGRANGNPDSLRISLTAYDNVTVPENDMTLSIVIGEFVFTSSSLWRETNTGWVVERLH